jgi:hypothetical protein
MNSRLMIITSACRPPQSEKSCVEISQGIEARHSQHTVVPKRSMNTENLMENKQKPGKNTNSQRLCTVELIHRRRCENSTREDSGAMVCASASGVNLVLNVGKCFSNSVVRKRSSPKENKFFLCKVSTLGSTYSPMIRFEMMMGRPLSAVRIL